MAVADCPRAASIGVPVSIRILAEERLESDGNIKVTLLAGLVQASPAGRDPTMTWRTLFKLTVFR